MKVFIVAFLAICLLASSVYGVQPVNHKLRMYCLV